MNRQHLQYEQVTELAGRNLPDRRNGISPKIDSSLVQKLQGLQTAFYLATQLVNYLTCKGLIQANIGFNYWYGVNESS